MKKLVTERELETLVKGGSFQVTGDMIVTPSARDFASRNGIQLQYNTDTASRPDSAMDRAIREAVEAELGLADPSVIGAVRNAMGGSGSAKATPLRDSPASRAVRDAAIAKDGQNRAVLSAMGENRKGILSTLTHAISDLGGDIQDVSQTLVGGYFTMILIVNLDGVPDGFGSFREKVLEAVSALGLEGMFMHEDILRAMHRV
jgi:ACT domain-containing protein